VDPTPQAAPASETIASRTTIADTLEASLAKCKNRAIQPTTMAKYRTFANQLMAYCADRRCVYINQLTVSDIDRFYNSWKDGIRGKAKKLERLKAFIKFCMKRKWLTEDIASDIEPPAGASIVNPKAPFTDEGISRIYAACDNMVTALRRFVANDHDHNFCVAAMEAYNRLEARLVRF
jgi:site-specific recombinase XerD